MKEVEGAHDNRPPSKHVEHVVVDEALIEDELIKNDNHISLKTRPIEDVEGECRSNSSEEETFVPTQDEGLNAPEQIGWKQSPQKQHKEWSND